MFVVSNIQQKITNSKRKNFREWDDSNATCQSTTCNKPQQNIGTFLRTSVLILNCDSLDFNSVDLEWTTRHQLKVQSPLQTGSYSLGELAQFQTKIKRRGEKKVNTFEWLRSFYHPSGAAGQSVFLKLRKRKSQTGDGEGEKKSFFDLLTTLFFRLDTPSFSEAEEGVKRCCTSRGMFWLRSRASTQIFYTSPDSQLFIVPFPEPIYNTLGHRYCLVRNRTGSMCCFFFLKFLTVFSW